MKKKSIIFALVVVLIIIVLLIYLYNKKNNNKVINNTNYNSIVSDSNKQNKEKTINIINEVKYKKIGNHLYYTDELINNKKENREKILEYYKKVSNYLENKYPSDFYIYNFNYMTTADGDDKIIFNIYQMRDMVIIARTMFSLYLENGKIVENDEYGENANNFIWEEIDTKANIDVEDVKEKALDLAKKHEDKMFLSSKDKKKMTGECYIEYDDTEKQLYYMIIINEGLGIIKINAKTGEILENYFWNGIMTAY